MRMILAFAALCCAAMGPPAMASPADDLGLSNTSSFSTNDSTDAGISAALPVSIRQAADSAATLGGSDVLQVEPIVLNGRAPLAPPEVGAAAYTG
jgi:hypothetical protein